MPLPGSHAHGRDDGGRIKTSESSRWPRIACLYPTNRSDPIAELSRSVAAAPPVELPRLRGRAAFAYLPLAAIFAFGLSARLAVALLLPPWQGPDEPRHFEYVRLLVDKRAQLWREHRLMRLDDDSPELQSAVIASLVQNHFWTYANRPPPATPPKTFYEIWAGSSTQLKQSISPYHFLLAAALVPFESAPLEAQLRVARVVTALGSALTVLVAYGVGREIAPGDRFVALVAGAFVAAVPMHAFMGGVVNTDNMVTLLGGATILLLCRGLSRPLRWRSWLAATALLIVAVFAKRAALVLVPWWLLVAVVRPIALRGRRWFLAATAIVAGALAVGAGVVLGVGPLSAARDALVYYFLNEPDQVARLFDGRLADPRTPGMVRFYLDQLHTSFWGVLGWYSVQLDEWLYAVLGYVTVACAAGLAIQLALWLRPSTRATSRPVVVLFLIGIVATLIPLTVLERLSYFEPFSVPTGRYLFVAIAPIAALYAVGGRALLPRRLAGTLAPTVAVIVALAALDVVVFVRTFVPAYLTRAVG